MRRFVGAIAGVAVAVIGCENSGSNRVLGIEATGDVVGFVYFDNNANREFDAGDGAVGGVEIVLLASGTGDTIASASSDDLGVFSLAGVPVGVYRVVVDKTTVGDSAIVARIDGKSNSLRNTSVAKRSPFRLTLRYNVRRRLSIFSVGSPPRT